MLFVRYSAINVINKITQASKEGKVFVYFITRLPRMEGGTSYVGFHGGEPTTIYDATLVSCFKLKE